MKKALAAPIPHIHFTSAYADKAHSRFAFGTNKETILKEVGLEQDELNIPVIIYISSVGKNNESEDIIGEETGYRAIAKLQKITQNENDPTAKRPDSTVTDTPFDYYYQLTDIKLLPHLLDHTKIYKYNIKKPIGKSLRSPAWVYAPDDFFISDAPKEILKEIETINQKLEEKSKDQGRYTRFIALANYGLFLTIIWRSFEAGIDIPWVAQIAALFFGLGGLFSGLAYLSDYLAGKMSSFDDFKRLKEILDEHGDSIKEKDAEAHFTLKVNAYFMRLVENKGKEFNLPGFIYEFLYRTSSTFAAILSGGFLVVGMLLLWLSVFF